MSEHFILYTENLSKHYKKTKAVDGVDLHIKQGEIYGFIGKNGAGKSTCLKMFSGLIHPTSGSLHMFDCEGSELISKNCFGRVGSLIEAPGLLPSFSGYDNLKLLSLYTGQNDKRIHEVLQIVGLEQSAHRKASGYSLGMKQRLGIALALLNKPDLLILDEPINGLDPQGIVEIRETLTRLNREEGITILISSHILEELAKLASTIGIIHKGKLLDEFSIEEFEKRNTPHIEITTTEPQRAAEILRSMNCMDFQIKGDCLYIENYTNSGELLTAMVSHGVQIHSINEKNVSLEEYYLSLTNE